MTAAVAVENNLEDTDTPVEGAIVPTVSVRLIQSLRLPPGHCAVVSVAVYGVPQDTLKLMEPDTPLCDKLGLELADALIRTSDDGKAQLVVTNHSGFTQRVNYGTQLGLAVDVIVDKEEADALQPELMV